MKVPIQNVYRLLLYAWDLIGSREAVDVEQEGYTELHDLFAHVLAETVGTLLARGLDRGYVPRDDSVQGVRGKLDWAGTLKHNELASARTRCRFDDLEYDVVHNRIIKATLRRLQEIDLHPKNRTAARKLEMKLDAVQDVRITAHDFRLVQLHGNNRLYEFAIGLCWVIHESLMIDPRSGRLRFRDYAATPQGMGSLFQSFVRNFYRLEQRRFSSRGAKVDWHAVGGSATDIRRLPEMVCDIVLEAPDRCIVLDTKFYAEALVGRGKEKKVISEHLYQILAYVQNRSAGDGGTRLHDGILLYPVVNERFGFDYRLLGHRVQVRSVDLMQPWPEIRQSLLALLDA